MGKHSRSRSFGRRAGFFLFASLCLVVGAFAVWSFVLSPTGGDGPVGEVQTPSVANAPEPAKEPAAKEEEEAKPKNEEENKDDGGDEEQDEGGSVDLASVPDPGSTELYLTVPKMGLTNDYVANGVDEGTLYNGAGHAPNTGFPWQEGANVYIASHVLGYEGTGSYMHFAALPSMTYGDMIYLSDAAGTEYTYQVSEIIQVSIYDLWVMDPTGKNQVSLQTCINPPAYDVRLVVRGDLVDVKTA
jgi:sortase A